VPTIVTIGVYGFSADTFIETLERAQVTLLIDVRQRRGVRGPVYVWANSRRLQAMLAEADIAYSHDRELAPTTELRQLQYREDDLTGVGKRTRQVLAPEYTSRYTGEILDRTDPEPLIGELPDHGLAALLCVETAAEACHRSLIAARLHNDYGFEVRHLHAAVARSRRIRSGPCSAIPSSAVRPPRSSARHI
jgi:uncharacterized protein (DUF488 family)